MNSAELVDYIATNSSVLKKDAKVAMRLLSVAINDQLKKGGAVTVAGLGKFYTVRISARVRRHPKTQAVINVAAKKKAKFQVSGALDDFINGR
jgi:nucleoid DNA-binding protein